MDSVAGITITSFLVGLSGAMMPGPVLTVTIDETVARLRPETPGAMGQAQTRGALAGPLIVLGHGILEILLVAAVVLGLGKLLILGPVIGTMAFLGGAVLTWMAWGMWKSVGKLSLRAGPEQERRRHPVLAGLLTDRTYRGLVTACAVLLLGFGLYFGYAGVRYLLA